MKGIQMLDNGGTPRSWRRRLAAGVALPVVLAASAVTGPSVAVTATAIGNGGWAGAWLNSGSGSGTGTTLAMVRSIIGADTGAAASLTGAGVGIALIDTGVAAVAGLPAAKVVNGPDLSFESQDPDLRYVDTYGHGTHMAGIMVANHTATGTKGIAPGAKLTSIKVGTSNGAVDVTQMIAAIDWVVANKNHDSANPIRVINLSYGSGGQPAYWSDPLQFAVEKAWENGILVVAAVGNNGNSFGKLTNPANDPYVLGVGASTVGGTVATDDDWLTTFTNVADNRPVDVLAPGESIVSLRDPGSNIDNGYSSARVGTALFKGSGTSQAAAVVSAAAALLLQSRPSATPDQVKNALKQGVWLPNGVAATRGFKLINVNTALTKVQDAATQTHTKSVGTGPVEDARGPSHVLSNGVEMRGEKSVFGTWSSSAWAPKAASKTSWTTGGKWMGVTIAGSGWNGTSWASKTWGAATWTHANWGGGTGWTDPSWNGRFWSNGTWNAGTWTGRFWSSDDWSTSRWE
jgi:serine protease AprX